jgi:CheY-like chemotaxis protein
MKRTFVRFVSHEIRTPLNIVTAGLKYVEDKMAAAGVSDRCPELLSTLTDMNESTSVVTSILDDLLIHEKIAAGQMKLEQVQVDASTFIAKSIQLFRAQASHKRVLLNIVNRLEADMHAILIDESKMTQVLRSIVLYAIRVTPELGTVEAHMYEADGCVTVEVTDSGPGTSEENKKQLFANVVQLDGRGDVALGLWISAKIMAMHGGEVGVRSDGEGRGSTFFVKIPLSTSLLTAVAPQQCRSSDQARVSVRVHPELTLREKIRRRFSMQDVASYRVVNDRVRILLVDDSALNRRILNRLLLADGFSGDEADDGEVAVRMCDVTSGGVAYDLVLMDHIMPHMSGPAATKELRRRGFQGVIVGITGNTAPADIKNFVDHGADAVLSKPLSVDEIRELIAMIHESLKVRQSMEE